MELLDIEAGELRTKISAAALAERRNARKVETAGEKIKLITKLCQHLEEFSIEEQNELAKKVLKSAVWDGETLSLTFDQESNYFCHIFLKKRYIFPLTNTLTECIIKV